MTISLLRQLAEFDTATICNAIEMFGMRPRNIGYMNAQIRSAFADLPPMLGFASTATVQAAKTNYRRGRIPRP